MESPLLATAAYVDPRLNHKKRSPEFLGRMSEVAEVKFCLFVDIVTVFDVEYTLSSFRNAFGLWFSELFNWERQTILNNTCAVETNSSTGGDDEDNLDKFIEFDTSRNATKTTSKSVSDKHLLENIRELGKQDKLKMKANIFGYYEQRKKQQQIDCILFDAVMVILSAPATQVSVESAFSALALLMDDMRCKLSSVQ